MESYHVIDMIIDARDKHGSSLLGTHTQLCLNTCSDVAHTDSMQFVPM